MCAQHESKCFNPNLFLFLAVPLGILAGWSGISFLIEFAKVISQITVDTLKLISIPIIFVALVSTISGMAHLNEMRTMGFKVLKYTLLTTISAATLALALFLIIDPVEISHSQGELATNGQQQGYFSALMKMYPSNVVKTFADNNVIGVVLIALFFGLSILAQPKDQKEFLHKWFKSLFASLITLIQYMLKFLPIGVWAFVSVFTAEMVAGENFNLSGLMKYIFCVFAATILQGVVVLPLLLKFKGISPIATFKGMFSALSLAFFSKSSSATMPVAMKCAQENLKVSERVSSLAFPLCTTINMNGCAAFILITVLFVSMSNGMVFSYFDLGLWVLIATLAAVGNAGVPMGCYFLSSAILANMDMPLNILALILPVYTLMDMVETAVNVWSDGCVACIVDKELKAEAAVELG